MSWTERLNEALPRVRLGTAVVDIHEWAHSDEPMDGPPHRHSYFVACRVEAGEGEFTAGERHYHAGPGDLLFVRPGVRHRIVGAQGFQLSSIAFEVTPDPAGLDEDDAGLVLQAFLAAEDAVVRDAAQVGAVWELLKEAARGPRTPGQRASLATLAPALLVSLARSGGGEAQARHRRGDNAAHAAGKSRNGRSSGGGTDTAAPRGGGSSTHAPRGDGRGDDDRAPAASESVPYRHLRAVRMAVRYIEDNLDRPLRVEELAKQVSVSPRQLTRLFATLLNEPPASYVERVRLERAACLLAHTGTPIKQIATDLGYPDVPTFTRAFARQHQSPPGRFRRACSVNGDRPGS